MAEWPQYRMARDLAGAVFPVSEAVILDAARKNDIGRRFGRVIIFSAADCERLYEVLPCPSRSSSAQSRLSGSSAAPSGEAALRKALALATDVSPRKCARNGRRNSSGKQCTVV